MAKRGVMLWKLLDLIDYNRDSENEMIQICCPGGSWDEYDEILVSSALLLPLYKAEVIEMAAIEKDVIRVDIKWDDLELYSWDNVEKGEEDA